LLQHGKVVRFDDGLSMIACKPLELPPAVARAFVKDIAAYIIGTVFLFVSSRINPQRRRSA
jgi:hypothetical protein